MPFPVEPKYIHAAETELGVIFPPLYKIKMIAENGGEAGTTDEGWTLFPFFDNSDNKRMSRTCNHIVLETIDAREWSNFPPSAVAIGENGCGDYLILQKVSETENELSEIPFSWWHETGEVHPVGNSINDFLEPPELKCSKHYNSFVQKKLRLVKLKLFPFHRILNFIHDQILSSSILSRIHI